MAKPEIINLARDAARGRKGAFDELCRRKQRDIAFAAYTMLGNYHDAEDAAQETILTMYRYIGKLKAPEAIDVWIEKIVRNRCSEILKKRTGRKDEVDVDSEEINIADDDREFLPAAYAEDAQMSGQIYDLVLTLPRRRREAIFYYYYEELSYKEIAEITGTTVQTVSTNLMKAKKMLKEKLAEYQDGARAGFVAAAPSTVMGRILKEQSVGRLPDDKMLAIEQRWTSSLKAERAAAARALGTKIIVAAASAAVCVGLVVGVGFGDKAAAAPSTSDVSALMNAEIVLAGEDCECGHINPLGIGIAGVDGVSVSSVWEIRPEGGGAAIFSGSEAEAAARIQTMIADENDGKYLLTCALTAADGSGAAVSLSRPFTIGDYAGDEV